MNRTHPIVTALAVFITFVTIIAGCGGSSNDISGINSGAPTPTPSGTPTPTPILTPTSTPTPGPKVLTISPTSTLLAPGMGQSFNTYGGSGTYTWTSTGGKLDIYGANATYTAGNTTGTFQVTVQNGTSTATATVVITTTPTPTPTPLTGISIVVSSVSPVAGSNVIIGQRVVVTFRTNGVTTGLVLPRPSEDGVTPSSAGILDSVQVTGGTLLCTVSMNTAVKTTAILFFYSASGGVGIQIPGSTYPVTYNWISPTMVVSIGSGGVFTPRDSGVVPPKTMITYRNDDSVDHTPYSPDTGMVSCPYIPPSGVCTFVTFNGFGEFLRVSVVDRNVGPAEVHTFTVSP